MKTKNSFIIACLIFGNLAISAKYQTLEKRPELIKLSKQKMSKIHTIQASVGQPDAVVSSMYVDFDLKGLNIIKGNKGKFYNLRNKQMAGQEISIQLPNIKNPVSLTVVSVQNLIKGEDVVTYTGHVTNDTSNFFTISVSSDGIMGKINHGNNLYIVVPLKGKTRKHAVAQLDKSLVIKDSREDVVTKNKIKTKTHVQ